MPFRRLEGRGRPDRKEILDLRMAGADLADRWYAPWHAGGPRKTEITWTRQPPRPCGGVLPADSPLPPGRPIWTEITLEQLFGR
jgi:hypothetical protein